MRPPHSEGAGCRNVAVLMYHSISEGAEPTCISPAVFRSQMDQLEQAEYQVVSLSDLGEWLRGGRDLPKRCAVLTFDDGFDDFASAAFPELQRRDWPATVFLPVGHVDQTDRWESERPGTTPRRLMSWSTIGEMATAGVDFGAHGVTHRDLTQLRGDDLVDEVLTPKRMIEERLSRQVASFAAPFGRTDATVDNLVRRHYRQAVGTVLARTRRRSDPYAIPRIEMWYFRKPQRWEAFLRGDAKSFLLVRQLLRRVRGLLAAGTRTESSADPRRSWSLRSTP